MAHPLGSSTMSRHQVALLEYALHLVLKIDQSSWEEIPADLHVSFAKYMGVEVWTGLPDLLTLREAALMILRDAIAHIGDFSEEGANEHTIDAGQRQALPYELTSRKHGE